MKKIGYMIFGIFYYIFRLFPINNKKIFLIMTHDSSDEGNVKAAFNYFKNQDNELFSRELLKKDYTFKLDASIFNKILKFFITIPFHIATSKNILMDNVFLPFSYISFKREINVVQLWHGTGTIKKFGLDVEKGKIKELATKANSKNTHLILGSKAMLQDYKSAFQMDESKIFPIGTPRTDLFFDKNSIEKNIDKFYREFPNLKNKKILLYAPTWRNDKTNKNSNSEKELVDFINYFENIASNSSFDSDYFADYVLGLRLHPSIFKNEDSKINSIILDNLESSKVVNFSHFHNLNTLLLVSDVLITDYSSIIFEYSLNEKPIVFYPYDLEEYGSTTGFYNDYYKFVPGPIVKDLNSLFSVFAEKSFNIDDIVHFKSIYLENCDGRSSKRLYKLLFQCPSDVIHVFQ